MDEGLEALKKLLQCITDTRFNTREFVDIALDVEKYNSVIEKELKALEIIKEMLNSDIGYKLNANSRKILKEIFESLPKEKQDLLKEVLYV